MNDPRSTGATIWLTGLPSAGKSTIARVLASSLLAEGHRVHVLDGDEVRASLTADLGFSEEDRIENAARIGFVARLLASHGVKVLVPAIAPYARSRAGARAEHARDSVEFLEVHVATPTEVCAARDVKGLYARQRAGTLTGLTGVDAPYEIPERPDLRIETHGEAVDESAGHVHALLAERGLA